VRGRSREVFFFFCGAARGVPGRGSRRHDYVFFLRRIVFLEVVCEVGVGGDVKHHRAATQVLLVLVLDVTRTGGAASGVASVSASILLPYVPGRFVTTVDTGGVARSDSKIRSATSSLETDI